MSFWNSYTTSYSDSYDMGYSDSCNTPRLSGYKIPRVENSNNSISNDVPKISSDYGYGIVSGGTILLEQYKNTENTPVKYGEYKSELKRKYVDILPAPKRLDNISEYDEQGNLNIFIGRDSSYPDELNALIHPASCDLCKTKMNSVCV